MTLDEYERFGKQLYEDFAQFIAELLSSAIKERAEMRLQHVQRRAKGLKSLRDRLQDAGVPLDDPRIELVRKDLAGCRLVFYTNTDVGRFRASGILNHLFEIDWARTRLHHPVDESSSLFRSDNIVVRLKEPQLSQPGCERFRGLACEIQIQTALNHAWSEMEHEIYKRSSLKGFGAARMRDVEDRMKKIMREHLLPAGYEFQKIRGDLDRLAAGKELFDQDALKALAAAEDNNQRFELLEKFSAYLLPEYDDIASVQADIRKTIADVLRVCRTTPVRPVETSFGSMEGVKADYVFDKAADILDTIRYSGEGAVESTFDVLCELYADPATNQEQKKRVLQSAEHLAKNELAVWDKGGPIVQHILADRILESDLAAAGEARPVLLQVLSELLTPVVTGTSSTYNTLTWKTRAANPTEALVTIRARAIEALKKLFQLSKTDDERRRVMQALSEAKATPHMGNYSDALLRLVLQNTLEIVEFYSAQVGALSFELLQKLEHDFLWLYRRNREMPADADRDPGVAETKKKLTAALLSFRDRVNQDEAFVTYKTLVGFESIFPPAWEDPNFEVEAEQQYRNEEIERLVEGITEANATKWLGVIRRCMQTKSDDLATFPNFGHFLQQLAKRKPTVALRYLGNMDSELEPAMPGLLKGLEESAPDAAAEKIRDWVENKKYLARILWYYRFATRVDADAIKRAAAAALEVDDLDAVDNALFAATARYQDLGAELIDTVLLPAIDRLEERGRKHWVGGGLGMVHGKESPFRHLSGDQARRVLAHLTTRERIGTRLDYLLGAIGKAHPEALMDFLSERVRRERELKSDREKAERYEAIPFRFHGANQALTMNPDYMLRQMRAWYRDDDQLFSLRAGRLVHSAYHKITPDLAASFLRFIEAGDGEDLAFVVEVLERFEGADETRPLYKAIVAKLPAGDPLLRSVGHGFAATGVVTGEFGMADAYRARLAAMKQWLEDPEEKVRRFAKEQVADLDRMIKAEQRRAEEDLELRKRNWGSGQNNEA